MADNLDKDEYVDHPFLFCFKKSDRTSKTYTICPTKKE